jgi:hypothetical protein
MAAPSCKVHTKSKQPTYWFKAALSSIMMVGNWKTKKTGKPKMMVGNWFSA